MGAKLASHVVLLVLAPLLLGACGVRFNGSFEGTELFKSLWLTRQAGIEEQRCDRQGATWVCPAGSRLAVNVGITNGYPVPVRVACYYEDPDALTEDQKNLAFVERATLIGETVLAPRPGLRPDMYAPDKKDDPAKRETLTFPFQAPPAGSYFLACLTPAAADNGVGVTLRISP
ncbi:MAG TPA: hypothetical protein VNN10_06685 [Dehalococcoidia bacterium]|nr:hypothetical protein [Dehalococcoidia bacterium]